jgi:hypothetical protein
MSNDKEGAERKKYGLLPTKIAESETVSPWDMMVCVDLVGPFTKRTASKTHSLLVIAMIDTEI